MLFLKSLPATRLAYGNFLWPDQVGAIVQSTTWDPTPTCGGGLHGLIQRQAGEQQHKTDDGGRVFAPKAVHGFALVVMAVVVSVFGDERLCGFGLDFFFEGAAKLSALCVVGVDVGGDVLLRDQI